MFWSLFFHFAIILILLIALFQLIKDTGLYKVRGIFFAGILLIYSFFITYQYIELANSHQQAAIYQYQQVSMSLHQVHENHQLQQAANLRDDIQHLDRLMTLSSIMDDADQDKLTSALHNIEQSVNILLAAFPNEEYDRYEDWFTDSDFEELMIQVSAEFSQFNRSHSRNPIGIHRYVISYDGNRLQRIYSNSEEMLTISSEL
ncbi:hypothetical protein SAMN05192551_1088 [Tindallia magadiensis]|uniref:Uncharacterized protein n=1 Tax=Tindallia magadiensis TaxID=69895 RepID=A0A1I3G503_9FIRM|nr:hypothetical protein [Tindallia magadiensis]SFI18553.1 hypothetical protein SAMN05192551_1088 [Tindallia magadiensis]